MRIGVISDTHGLLRPEAVAALAGVEHVLHAGDIGAEGLIGELAAVAPVTAIRGNVDGEAWAEAFAETVTLMLGGVRLHMLHDPKTLALDPVAQGIAVVISGHSHRPAMAWRNGVLHLHPGAAGPRRFRLPVSLAILTVGEGAPLAEIVDLPLRAVTPPAVR